MTGLSYRDPLTKIERLLQAGAWLLEAAEDFLASEYPAGTAHEADREADRLRRAVDAYRTSEQTNLIQANPLYPPRDHGKDTAPLHD